MNQCKLTDLTVNRKITDSISENLTDSDLESILTIDELVYFRLNNTKTKLRNYYYF